MGSSTSWLAGAVVIASQLAGVIANRVDGADQVGDLRAPIVILDGGLLGIETDVCGFNSGQRPDELPLDAADAGEASHSFDLQLDFGSPPYFDDAPEGRAAMRIRGLLAPEKDILSCTLRLVSIVPVALVILFGSGAYGPGVQKSSSSVEQIVETLAQLRANWALGTEAACLYITFYCGIRPFHSEVIKLRLTANGVPRDVESTRL